MAKTGRLCSDGGRGYTRGWTGAKYVKRLTTKSERREAKRAIKDNDGVVLKARTKGWVD